VELEQHRAARRRQRSQTWGVFSQEIKTITGALALGEFNRSRRGFEVFTTTWDDSNRAFLVAATARSCQVGRKCPTPTPARAAIGAILR
jgi:hypothetical protein